MSTHNEMDAELERIQKVAIEHAVQEMDAAAALTLDTKGERGDRGWLTGMAAKSLGVAVRIEQFMALRRGDGQRSGDDEEQQARAKTRMVAKAKREVASILERVGVGSQASE